MSRKKDVFIVGTRPEVIKMAPILLRMARSEYILVHTGQHEELADEAFKVFGLEPNVRMRVMVPGQLLSEVFTGACEGLTRFFIGHAIETKRTLTALIEDAVRLLLAQKHSTGKKTNAKLPVFKSGGVMPGVDLDHTASLLDVMEDIR